MGIYHNEDDIWCEYGEAYSQIKNALKDKHTHIAENAWRFDKAYVFHDSQRYRVSAIFTVYDPTVNEIILVSSTSEYSLTSDSSTVSCSDAKIVDWDNGKNEYKLRN